MKLPDHRHLAAASLLVLAACGQQPHDPRTDPALVEVAIASGTPDAAERRFTGVVSARIQSDLGFRVPGKITERLVDTGQTVHKGQVLMRIDAADYSLGASAAQNEVAAARARAAQTAADERRYRDLVGAGAVSASRYDQAKADADAARAQLAAALAQAGVARNATSYSVLVADADGVVVQTLAEPGQVVTAGQVVIKLAHAGPREATISLPETIRPAIGSTARATLFGGAGPAGSGRLRQLSDAADPQTRTFDARYVLEGPAAAAPLGSTVEIALAVPAQAARQGNAAGREVPLSALLDRGHGPGVWSIVGRDGARTLHWIPVTVTALGEETATVAAGLDPGQRFVALGAHALHEGQAVVLATSRLGAHR